MIVTQEELKKFQDFMGFDKPKPKAKKKPKKKNKKRRVNAIR